MIFVLFLVVTFMVKICQVLLINKNLTLVVAFIFSHLFLFTTQCHPPFTRATNKETAEPQTAKNL